MNVLLLTNLYPCIDVSSRGIFITKRLQQYAKFRVQFTAVPVGYGSSGFQRLVKKVFGGINYEPLAEHYGVKYLTPGCNGTLEWILVRSFGRISRTLEYSVYFSYLKRFEKYLERTLVVSSYDIIHAHGMFQLPAGLLAKMMADKLKKPYVITLHGDDVNFLMSDRNYYLSILESASAVIFVSNALLEKAKSFGYSGRNSLVIPNGYDPEIFKPLDKDEMRRQIGIYENGCKYVGFVGALKEIKRADKLIDIFEKIRQEIGVVRFIVVGDGHLRSRMEKEAKQKGLKVLFTGIVPQEEVAKYMNAMDVMVLPSRQEGFGAVVIEAQACGTCVVGSNNGGIPEAVGFPEYIVEDGEDFEERFAQRVADVLRNGYDRETFVSRTKEYTWEKIVSKEIMVYRSILNNTFS